MHCPGVSPTSDHGSDVAAAETPWSENAITVLRRRYLRKDAHGQIVETPAQLLRRVAQSVAALDPRRPADAFCEAMARLELMPNSPTLMNAGKPSGQLS